MRASALAGTVGRLAATGLAGAVLHDVARHIGRRVSTRDVAVSGTALGLRAVRGAERGAEAARLRTADIVAEARERIGEQASPPGGGPTHDHDHEH